MPSNYTSNYRLNQWEPDDQVLCTDFNADNAKIDGALAALSQTVKNQGTTLNQYGSAMNRLGNCRISRKTFASGGSAIRLTFPGRPLIVFVLGETETLTMAYGISSAVARAGGAYASVSVTWEDRAVSWTGTGSVNGISGTGTHVAIALIDAEG